MKTLILTSPHLKGDDVRNLQTLLSKKGWLHGGIDGDYGPLTAQAVFRAKFWLGYAKPDQNAGDVLVAYLSGKRHPTKPMQALSAKRRADQKRKEANKPRRVRRLETAISQIGTKESPAGSNHTKYGVWYGFDRVSWCAIFCSWCDFQVGGKFHYAYVPYVVHDAIAARNGLTVTTNPQPGDYVTYDWDNDRIADHIGMFEKWIDRERGIFSAIEGNTAVGNDSNGGEVMRRQRSTGDVMVFAHEAE